MQNTLKDMASLSYRKVAQGWASLAYKQRLVDGY